MISRVRGGYAVLAALALQAAGAGLMAAPAMAQSQPAETTDQKVRRHDGEIKALQRKVFPEGAGKFFTPEIAPAAPVAGPTGTPATSAVSDLLVRMDSLEGQVTRLTSQLEESQNRVAKLEAQVAALTPAPAPVTEPLAATPAPSNGATIATNTAAMTGGASAPKPAPVAPKPTPAAERVAAVQAIEKPQTADRGDDEYSYGYRLWEAKFYPEAQQQLLQYLGQYPRHAKVSYARNLLGRAYLDDGMPGTAAQYFVQNYQSDPAGARAPDSLLYLAVAMTRINDTKKACVALKELGEKYPAVASGRLATEVARTRSGAKCN